MVLNTQFFFAMYLKHIFGQVCALKLLTGKCADNSPTTTTDNLNLAYSEFPTPLKAAVRTHST